MAFPIRALTLGLAAGLAYLLMTALDDGQGGANIGAGLAVFGVLAVGSFIWALVDGLDRGTPAADRIGLARLWGRWLLVALTVVVILELRAGIGLLESWDLDRSSALFLGLLVLVPGAVGALVGLAARS